MKRKENGSFREINGEKKVHKESILKNDFGNLKSDLERAQNENLNLKK